MKALNSIKGILESVIEGWEEEYKFCERKWRFDYANPRLKVAIEIEGGIWINGRHIRGRGYKNDMEKYNRAQILGWKVMRYEPVRDIKDIGKICEDLLEIIRRKNGEI